MAARRKKPDLPHIAEPLRELAVPVDSLTPDPANARTHGKRNLAAIRASLAKFGQRMPIVVQRNGMVVRAGNGRLEAARELGWRAQPWPYCPREGDVIQPGEGPLDPAAVYANPAFAFWRVAKVARRPRSLEVEVYLYPCIPLPKSTKVRDV